ncbi:MAG TPA: 2,3-bisphosphoglycerate-independent phosphoglycerate mutase [Phycisphaerales bacterium]|nr:2,3-bisphosphoglycerate-independent phosphoglycerate mutase [Phycisphaerales bacterium]
MPKNTPFVLVIRDGWGENPNAEHDRYNAVKLAKTPVDAALRRDWPMVLIRTSGEDVGLEAGQMGNSEVGHQNIGAGRIVDQESLVITKAARAGLGNNKVLVEGMEAATRKGTAVHLMGICSDAGVHGLLRHLFALIDLARDLGVPRLYLHLFTDGRDTGPFLGAGFIGQVQAKLREAGAGREWAVASVIGRYYAMDRDNRWERVQKAYAALTGYRWMETGVALGADAGAAAQAYYESPRSETQKGDEFVPPTMIGASEDGGAGALSRRIRDGDTVIYYNYRGDRPRELVRAFVLPEFEGHVAPSPDTKHRGFDRGPKLDLHFVTMAAYEEALNPYVKVAFPKPPKLPNIGGQYWSSLGLRQFRCAETEKYPHVTFFFNDYRDEPFPGESRCIKQSPKVATYDLQPEMSAGAVCEVVLERLAAHDCEDVIVVNFANADMVGHTGSLPAAIAACEAVDACVGKIVDATLARGGSLIVTADHGNAEQMWDPVNECPHTSHTTYDVPLFVIGREFRGRRLRMGGRLGDIVPTALAMMGLSRPEGMTGESLLA